MKALNQSRGALKAKQAAARRRETWMAGLGGQPGRNNLSFRVKRGLFKHNGFTGLHQHG